MFLSRDNRVKLRQKKDAIHVKVMPVLRKVCNKVGISRKLPIYVNRLYFALRAPCKFLDGEKSEATIGCCAQCEIRGGYFRCLKSGYFMPWRRIKVTYE